MLLCGWLDGGLDGKVRKAWFELRKVERGRGRSTEFKGG